MAACVADMDCELVRAAELRREVSRAIRPRVRMSVSDAAEKYVRVRTPSGGTAPWDPDLTPYIVEPMNMLSSRHHDTVVFVGPARTGKTQGLIDGWAAYMIKCEPCTMQIVHMTQETARKYSRRRIDKMHRDSPELKAELSPGAHNDNTYDKYYRAGNVLGIVWPSITNFSGDDIKFIALTDYDRMPEDIGGEGSAYHLANKRTQTFLSRGMTLVETSPGYEVLDPKWSPRKEAPHEAPPSRGALSLYNLGDRRRLYWRCPHCDDWFMPLPSTDALSFKYDVDLFGITDPQIIGDFGVPCTRCGSVIKEQYKQAMNACALWVPEGCTIKNGKVAGTPRRTKIASYWQPGVSAAYQNWESLIQKYLNALRVYDITDAEEALKTVINVDFGMPYLPRRLMSDIGSRDIESRAEDVVKRAVMPGVRFITASIDVQKNHFVVQVHGRGMGDERWLIDRFNIRNSKRIDAGEIQPVDPATYGEDWDLITEKVIKKTYPLADDSGRRMPILAVCSDAYGLPGVTERAYKYWTRLKKIGLHNRFFLMKGERPAPHVKRPRVSKSFPDNSARSSRKANAHGQVPVWLLNTTMLKDNTSADLKRANVGPRYLHFPDWLKGWFYEELTAEVRGENGWENPSRARNEAFDLLGYEEGLVIAYLAERRITEIDWSKPPRWAAEWDDNSQIDLEIKDSTETISPFRKRGLRSKGVGK